MKKIALILMLAGAYVLAGCNTVEGFGKDVRKVGEKMEESAASKKK